MTDERCKQIMEQLGMPNSRSLMQALYQVANETEQEVRNKLTADNSDYAKCLDDILENIELNAKYGSFSKISIAEILKRHFA